MESTKVQDKNFYKDPERKRIWHIKEVRLVPCKCGKCGLLTITPDVWGHPHEYRQGHYGLDQRGEKNHHYIRGWRKRPDGYIYVLHPNHPRANKNYVMKHLLMMEEYIGRHITTNEVVHHKNKIKDDNRLENLYLMTFGEHSRYHNYYEKYFGKAPLRLCYLLILGFSLDILPTIRL